MENKLLIKTTDELKALFQDALAIKWLDIEVKQPTFMDISGYPHFENVSSNIYQFFLKEMHHGLGSLFLSALDDCIDGADLSMDDYIVSREVYTDMGGRIDLLIEQLDENGNPIKVVLIENKIYHTLDNNLKDYWDTYSSVNDRTLIVLTLKEKEVREPFINVTHQQWIKAVKNRLGNVISGSNLKYLTLLQDFIQHMENYYEKSIEMDALNYLYDNGEKIEMIKLLEKEGMNYIAVEIGKKIVDTQWEWGRIIPSGLQIPRANKPILGYIYFNKIFIEHEFMIDIWLKGEEQVKHRQEIGITKEITSLAEMKDLKLMDSRDSKGWYNIARKTYQVTDKNEMENLGEIVLEKLNNDWEEFTVLIEDTYIK